MLFLYIIVALVVIFLCFAKSEKITYEFEARGIYSRNKATAAALFLLLSLSFYAMSKANDNFSDYSILFFAAYVLLFSAAVFLYMSVFFKSPSEFKLKVLPCMFISGIGGIARALATHSFIGMFGEKVDMRYIIPKEILDSKGNICTLRVDKDFIFLKRNNGEECCFSREKFVSREEYDSFSHNGEIYYITAKDSDESD